MYPSYGYTGGPPKQHTFKIASLMHLKKW